MRCLLTYHSGSYGQNVPFEAYTGPCSEETNARIFCCRCRHNDEAFERKRFRCVFSSDPQFDQVTDIIIGDTASLHMYYGVMLGLVTILLIDGKIL